VEAVKFVMGESILLLLWVATTIFLGVKIETDRKNRESHEWWLSEVKECIHSIECEFRHKCEKIAEEEFSKTTLNEYQYSVRIRELEKAYKNNLTDRVIAFKRVRITTVPDHLEQEYLRNISDISSTFRYFGNLYHQ
jgi:hypothetical protein